MTDNHMIEMVNKQFNRERINRLNQEALTEILRIKSVFYLPPPIPHYPPFNYCPKTCKKVFHTNGRSTFFTPLPKNPFKKDREEQIEAINITFAWLITLVFLITICIHIISH
jgi:hypothetical protein